jgi:hypothetical protein
MQTVTNQFDPNPAAPATGNIVQPSSMEVNDIARLKPRNEIRRDVPRYIVQAGDLLPPSTKRNWKLMQGFQLGGQWFDQTDIPCLWKFQGFITRGRITPLIKRPVMCFQAEEKAKKKAEEIAEVAAATGQPQAVPEVYRMSFPWDSLQSLLSEFNAVKGVTEVTVLEAVEWETGIVQEIQKFFFPNWEEIIAARAEMPFTVSDFRTHIKSRIAGTNEDTLISVGEAYLESAEKFEMFARQVVQHAREAVGRGMNEQGWAAVFSPFQQHLADQIGVTLENKPTVIVQQQGQAQPAVAVATNGLSPKELELKEREINAIEEANRLKAAELGLTPPFAKATNEVPDDAPTLEAAFAPQNATDVQFADMEITEPEVDAPAAGKKPKGRN